MFTKVKNYGAIDIVRIPLHYSTGCTMSIAALKIAGGIVPTLNMLVTAEFINETIALFSNKGTYNNILFTILLIILFTAYLWIYPHIVEITEVKLENDLRKNFRVLLIDKVASLKYNYIENQDVWDLITRVLKQPDKQCKKAYDQFLDMICLILNVLGVLYVLFTRTWWTAIIIILLSIPLFILAIKGGKASYEANRDVEKYSRKATYLSDVLNGRDAVEERTLFRYSKKVNYKWYKQFEKVRKVQFKVNLEWYIKAKFSGIVTTFLSSIIILILISPVKSGTLSVGLFISVINNIVLLIQDLSWQLPNCVDNLAKNKEYLEDLNNLLRLEGKEGFLDKPCQSSPRITTLEFKNVSFKYPGTNRYILNNMSFKLEEGKHYAFVGINGAGKTTITKLITGLYEDFEGQILINGISIKKYSQSQIKSMFSVVYQDFSKYYISLKDNIALGNVNGCSVNDINNALEIMDLKSDIDSLPKGINTNLGMIKKDGIDLSGGQWQRIAMARAIVSCGSIIILDEPTAALDPISESHMYEKFKAISKDRTTIFISHRLGSTKISDEIFVIENGEIIEKGSHKELMKLNGCYARMFESQKNWYVDNK